LLGCEDASGPYKDVGFLIVRSEEDLVEGFDGGGKVGGGGEPGASRESRLEIEDALLSILGGHPEGEAIERGAEGVSDIPKGHRGVDEGMGDTAGGFF